LGIEKGGEKMQVYKINSMSPVYDNYKKRVTPEKLLDESVFYKLLITQLKNQDPLSPIKPEDFTAQLAQLTQLEEIRKLNNYIKLIAASLIGKSVITNKGEKETKKIMGIEIDNKDHQIILELEDGSSITLDEVKSIREMK